MREIPKLSHSEKRELIRVLLESEQDGQVLTECDQLH